MEIEIKSDDGATFLSSTIPTKNFPINDIEILNMFLYLNKEISTLMKMSDSLGGHYFNSVLLDKIYSVIYSELGEMLSELYKSTEQQKTKNGE